MSDSRCARRRRLFGLMAGNASDVDSNFSARLIPGLDDDVALRCLAGVSDLGSMRGICRRWKEVIDTSEQLLQIRATLGRKPVNWVYVLVRDRAGSDAWHTYDPSASTWRQLPAMPDTVDFQLVSPGSIGLDHRVQCVNTGKKLVMLAGLKLSASSKAMHRWSPLEPALERPWIFDPRKFVWTKGQPFRSPRRWCVCGVAGEKVYVASGCGLVWNSDLAKATEMYDPDSDAWESLPATLASSKFSGEALSFATVQDKLYVVSGKGVCVKVGAVFCPETMTWSHMPKSLRAGWIGTGVGVDDRLYVVDEWSGKLSVFDFATERWEVVLEDERLKGLVDLTSGHGMICGRTQTDHFVAEEGISSLRVIHVNLNPPLINEVAAPPGRVLSIQLLERSNMNFMRRISSP